MTHERLTKKTISYADIRSADFYSFKALVSTIEKQLSEIEQIAQIAMSSNIRLDEARETFKQSQQIQRLEMQQNLQPWEAEELFVAQRNEKIQKLVQDKEIDGEAGRQIIEIERLQRDRGIPRSEAEKDFQGQQEVLEPLDVAAEKSERKQAWRAIVSNDRAIDRERRIDDREKQSRGEISRKQAENEINSQDRRARLAKKILKSYFDDKNVKMQLGDWIRGEPDDRPYIPDSVRASSDYNIEQNLERERQRREESIIKYGAEFIGIERQWRKRINEILRDFEPETPDHAQIGADTRDRTYSGSPTAHSRSDSVNQPAHRRPASNLSDDESTGQPAKRQRVEERPREGR